MPAAGVAIALSGNLRGDRLQKSNNALLKKGDHFHVWCFTHSVTSSATAIAREKNFAIY
ncbi:hypothetical protein [Nostoc sp.]|uniref:hypothetical protein n=1 Tax=Nostoc sp. TaxID=1180 RepID=UPI002FF731A1